MITWTGQATVHSKIKLGAARIVQPQHSRTGYFACAPMQHLISNAAQCACVSICSGCRGERLRVACSMYMLQNGAVALSALSALFSYHLQQGSVMFWIATAITIIVGSISSIGAQGSTLSVEKEWTTALCQGKSAALAQYNAGSCPAPCPCTPAAAYLTKKFD